MPIGDLVDLFVFKQRGDTGSGPGYMALEDQTPLIIDDAELASGCFR